jgi:hypothetical protein
MYIYISHLKVCTENFFILNGNSSKRCMLVIVLYYDSLIKQYLKELFPFWLSQKVKKCLVGYYLDNFVPYLINQSLKLCWTQLQMGGANTTCKTCRSECCALAYKPHAKCQSCMVAGLKMSDNTLCFQLIYLTAFMEPVWPWCDCMVVGFLFLPYDCLLHHIENYAILIFVRHAQRIVKPKFK